MAVLGLKCCNGPPLWIKKGDVKTRKRLITGFVLVDLRQWKLVQVLKICGRWKPSSGDARIVALGEASHVDRELAFIDDAAIGNSH